MPHHCTISVLPLGIFHVESLWVLGIQDLTQPSAFFFPLQSWESCVPRASVCQTTYCLLPGSSSLPEVAFRVCICISPLSGPTLQHRLSPALVSWIFTWHIALYCVLGVFVVTAGPCFTSAQQPGCKCRGPLGWGLHGKNSVARG